jgi:hypothetical protein
MVKISRRGRFRLNLACKVYALMYIYSHSFFMLNSEYFYDNFLMKISTPLKGISF